MTSRARIAVILPDDPSLAAGLRNLPAPPLVRQFADLCAEFEALRDFAPDVLVMSGDALSAEDAGALRLVAVALPRVAVALLTAPEREVAIAAAAAAAHAHVLVRPAAPARVLALARDRGRAGNASETFLDLVRGISDEINNPLLFALGHLQLLGTLLDPQATDALDQVASMREGLGQIANTMDKIRLLARARTLEHPLPAMAADALVHASLAAGAPPQLLVQVGGDLTGAQVVADAELMPKALTHLRDVGVELLAAARAGTLRAELEEQALRVRLELAGLRFDDWQLPRAFEPYYLNRLLRGTVHGLALFIVHTVVTAHGGQATARRLLDGSLAIELAIPRLPDLNRAPRTGR